MNSFCYTCAQPTSVNENGYPVCLEHGVLWALRRNSLCAETFVVRDDGKVLLIKRASEPLIGFWALPGGFSEYGEAPSTTAVREALEETGWMVELTGEILGVYLDSFPGDASSEHRVVVSYLAKPVSEGGAVDGETQGHEWFSLDDIPENLVPPQMARFVDYRKR